MRNGVVFAICLFIGGCSSGSHGPTTVAVNRAELAPKGHIAVQTPAVAPNGTLAAEFTASGRGTEPNITWSAVPPGTKEIEVLIEDPDAPGDAPYIHLLVEGIDPKATGFPSKTGTVVKNSDGRDGYSPPNPPPGKPHHYHFEVVAIDTLLGSYIPMDRDQLLQRATNHVTASGEVVGTFGG